MEKEIVIKVKNLQRHYHSGKVSVKALNGVDFEVHKGEFVAIMGPSGSGKTTMLRVLGLMDTPTHGEHLIKNLNVEDLLEDEKTYYRLTQLGYVFQDYALINELSALENVYILSLMEGKSSINSMLIAQEALNKVGLGDKGDRVPDELSGGEKQRVAIARAIAKKPSVLFADEPCANLDSHASKNILEIFKKLNKEYGLTIVMVTHEKWHLDYVSRVIELKDGKIVRDKKIN
jgi:putative ABC transport system ATP-binding protein